MSPIPIPIPRLSRAVAVVVLVLGGASSATAQAAVEVGGGWAFGVPGGSGAAHAGVVWPAGAPVAGRGALAWSAGRVLGSVEALVPLERGVSVLVPYLVVGGGVMWGGKPSEGVITGGLGLGGRVGAHTDGLLEVRALWGADGPRGPDAVLTAGVRWHPRDRRMGRREVAR